MVDKVPRRLMRFQRIPAVGESPQKAGHILESNPASKDGRNVLDKMPSMDYTDLAKLKEQKDKGSKKGFCYKDPAPQQKKQVKPIDDDGMAESLFSQIKSVEIENDSEKNTGKTSRERPGRARGRRAERNEEANNENDNKNSNKIPQANNLNPAPQTQATANVKSLFEANDLEAKKSQKTSAKKALPKEENDEFDLGLDGEQNAQAEDGEKAESDEEFDSLEEEEIIKCPSCNKTIEKIIYCPKCGAAFCKNCAKTVNAASTCPKCNTKVAII
ncbi:MAG: hypothetical protein NTY48_00075 [Candidatus Diapherotrites archaeon]|nr:hypothetical protein [Candidatus Diapherotrites archaeon]